MIHHRCGRLGTAAPEPAVPWGRPVTSTCPLSRPSRRCRPWLPADSASLACPAGPGDCPGTFPTAVHRACGRQPMPCCRILVPTRAPDRRRRCHLRWSPARHPAAKADSCRPPLLRPRFARSGFAQWQTAGRTASPGTGRPLDHALPCGRQAERGDTRPGNFLFCFRHTGAAACSQRVPGAAPASVRASTRCNRRWQGSQPGRQDWRPAGQEKAERLAGTARG